MITQKHKISQDTFIDKKIIYMVSKLIERYKKMAPLSALYKMISVMIFANKNQALLTNFECY